MHRPLRAQRNCPALHVLFHAAVVIAYVRMAHCRNTVSLGVYVLQSRSSEASAQWMRASQRHAAAMQRAPSAHAHSSAPHALPAAVALPATAASPGTSAPQQKRIEDCVTGYKENKSKNYIYLH